MKYLTIASLSLFIGVSATLAQEEGQKTRLKRVEPDPAATKYQYNAQDGYYYNTEDKELVRTVRDEKTGFYISVGIGAAVIDNTAKLSVPGVNTSKGNTDFTYAPIAKMGYDFPGKITWLPGDPNFAIESDFVYTESGFDVSGPGGATVGNRLDNYMFSLTPMLSFTAFENRVRWWMGVGPTLYYGHLNAPSNFLGASLAYDDTAVSPGLNTKLGGEYFFNDFFSLYSEFGFNWIPSTTWNYNVGGAGGRLEAQGLMALQLRLGAAFHF